MKKVFLLFLFIILVFALTGCVDELNGGSPEDNFDGFEIHRIPKEGIRTGEIRTIIIIVDKQTDVMYMVIEDNYPNLAMTIMLDEEGKPLLWSEYNRDR